jgi:hypothetical protein
MEKFTQKDKLTGEDISEFGYSSDEDFKVHRLDQMVQALVIGNRAVNNQHEELVDEAIRILKEIDSRFE